MNETEPGPVVFELDHPQLTFPRLIQAAEDFLDVLREVAADLLGSGGVQWIVEDVSRSSPVHLSVRPVAMRESIGAAELSSVSSTVSEGFALIQEQGKRPRHFSDLALEKARDLARRIGSDLSLVRVGGPGGRTTVTAQIIANIDVLLGEEVTAIGSVDGRLLGLNVHGQRYFNVYDGLSGERVRCYFGHRIDVEDVGAAVERRVTVQGEIKYRPTGQIVSMIAHSLETFPHESELPTADAVRGILAG